MAEATAREGVEQEQPEAVTEPEEEKQPETLPEGDEPEVEAEQEQEPEKVEFDFGGNKLSVPKASVPEEVREALDKFAKGTWSDYTKRTQTVAEREKSLEAREGAVQRIRNLTDQALSGFANGLSLRNELEQLRKIDLNPIWQSDPDQARRISDAISAKQAGLNQIVSQVNQYETELTNAQRVEMDRRRQEGAVQIERHHKGFSEKAPEVVKYVTETFGVSRKEAEDWKINPVAAIMAYESMLYRKMTAQASKGVKPKPAPAVPIVPIKGKGGSASKGPKEMSVAEMAKHLGLPVS